MRFNDAYIICIETISVHAFRSDAKLKPFQMRFMFTGFLLRRTHSQQINRTLKLGFYIWKFGNGIFSKSVYASFKLITKTNK